MKPLDTLPTFLREEAAWRRIRGGEPRPAVNPLPPHACRGFLRAQIRENIRSGSSWGSGNRFARRFASLWSDVPRRPGLSTIAPQYATHWLSRPDVQKERAAWFFRRACKFVDWQKGRAEGLPFYLEGRPASGFFASP
jgi:hypothetical protein